MSFLLLLPLPSPESRRLHRELRLSAQVFLAGCVLGALLVLAAALLAFLSSGPLPRLSF